MKHPVLKKYQDAIRAFEAARIARTESNSVAAKTRLLKTYRAMQEAQKAWAKVLHEKRSRS